ncbi:HAD family hydrolase [Candidatus Woesearchaeota archaeon]|nr:HAD family hydrolase [Candidatus Woesearchaeota archaeon]
MASIYLFDLDGTIINPTIYKEIYHEVLLMIAKNKEISLVELELEASKVSLRKNSEGKFDTGELCKHFDLIEEYYDILGPKITATDLANKEVLSRMNKAVIAGKKVGIVSNSFTRTILLYVKRYKLPVDFVFSAEEAGYLKSDIRFWRALIKAHRLPLDCVVVGNDPIEDVKMPEKVGFKGEMV